ncbi:Arm DNA-binding domain-containing protein, partial [Vibrio tasmaniensis]|uniref:Arm DNA-binding domain-containing protein n=1 Tax=Vibrio tasmaniensis TaxID=212663 RepID=UPI00107FCBA7
MKKKFKFTTSLLKSLPVNPPDAKGTELEFSNTEITGFKCLSGKSGSKRFLLRYTFQGRKTSIAIGRIPDIDLATARKISRQRKAQIAIGIDPKAERVEIANKPP